MTQKKQKERKLKKYLTIKKAKTKHIKKIRKQKKM